MNACQLNKSPWSHGLSSNCLPVTRLSLLREILNHVGNLATEQWITSLPCFPVVKCGSQGCWWSDHCCVYSLPMTFSPGVPDTGTWFLDSTGHSLWDSLTASLSLCLSPTLSIRVDLGLGHYYFSFLRSTWILYPHNSLHFSQRKKE